MQGAPIECRQCEKKMDLMCQPILLKVRPTAAYTCPGCKKRVLLFTARSIKEPQNEAVIKIWSDEFYQQCNISVYAQDRAAAKGLELVC